MKMGRFCVIGILVIIVSAQVRQRFAYTNYTIPCVLGTSCILPCKMDPYQKNASVSWLNSNEEYLTRGKTIINPDSTYLGIEKSANNTWNLHNKNVTRNFAGTYKCEAKIGSKQMTLSVVTLVIESKPTLDERNSSGSNSKFKEGEDAELNCVFDGSPAPEIKWHRGRSME
ncbi:neural cell adhesion molecule 2-like, partial [Ruditapes philippinarum]